MTWRRRPSARWKRSPAARRPLLPCGDDHDAVVGAVREPPLQSPLPPPTLPDARPLALLKQWGLVSFERGRYDVDPLVAAAVGVDDSARRPHYDYYKALAWQHDENQDYAGLDVESANLEAAFEWAIEADAEAAYWLANACRSFLANRGRFDQRQDWMERVADKLKGHPDAGLQASVQVSLGIVFGGHPTGDRAGNLRRAIACYEAALVYRTPQSAPLYYAATQNNLGTAYYKLAQAEDQAGNLRRTTAAFEAALVYYTPESTPLYYAMTRRTLGIVHETLGDLSAAVACWCEAEKYYRQMGAVADADLMLEWIASVGGACP